MKRIVVNISQKYATINFITSLLFCIVALKLNNESSKWLLIYSLIQQGIVLIFLVYNTIYKKQFKENIVGLIEDFAVIYITICVFLFTEYYVYSKMLMAIGCSFPFLLGTSKEWVKKQGENSEHRSNQSGDGSVIDG